MTDESDDETAPNRVKSTRTLFTIVEELRGVESAGVSELADRLGMPKSTVHVHLKTLEEEGYLMNDEGNYRLGFGFLEVGGEVRQRLDVFRSARSELDAFSMEVGEVTHLGIEERGKRVLVYSSHPADGVFDDSPVGHRTNMHWTALGKALLAQLSDERIAAILDTHGLPEATESTITDRDVLYAELETVRERGYAVGDGEHRDGIKTIAMALDHGGARDVPSAIGLSGPTHRIERKNADDELVEAVRQAANVVELTSEHY